MATYYQNSDIVGVGVAFNLSAGDTLFVARDADLASTGGNGISGAGQASVYVYGSVFGSRGISVGAAGSTSEIVVGDSGIVASIPGGDGITVSGGYRITNYGQIAAEGNLGYGIRAFGSGILNNFGHITAGVGVFLAGDSNAANTINNFGEIVGTSTTGSVTISGSAGADRVINRGILQGDVNLNAGNDTFVVADGRLFGTLNGGSGSDTISYEGFSRGVIVDAAVGATWDGQRTQLTVSVENATGTSFNDVFFGSADDNIFNAGAAGIDQIYGFDGNDTVSYSLSVRGVIVDLTAGASYDGVESDVLSSIENAIGSRFNDTIYGTEGNNVIDGGAEGADKLYGLGGIDTISYATSERGVIIDMISSISYDGISLDVIQGFENATGSAFNDSIYGDNGANTFVGGRGADTIISGGGADRIVAASVFDLTNGTGADTITDFAVGTDKLVFNINEGYSASALFVSGAAPAPANGSAVFLYNTTTGMLSYDADGNGGGAAVNIETLSNLPSLTLSDFAFV